MNKHELLAQISVATGVSRKDVEFVIDALQDVIVNATIEKGDEITLQKLGKFKRKVFTAREGINPLTKQHISIPESHTVAFRPTSSIKKIIQPKAAKKGEKQ